MDSPSTAASAYTVLASDTEIITEIERKKSRFLTVMRRAESSDRSHQLVDDLRRTHHTARHHCSAWVIGADRRIQRAFDDGEPSGTAGAPMLEALVKASMPSGREDLSDVVVVVVRWFGGTLLGAGGLVSAYSDSVIAALESAGASGAFRRHQRLRQYSLLAPIAEAGRWENELRSTGVSVLNTDYGKIPGNAALTLAIPDEMDQANQLAAKTAAVSSGTASLEELGTAWVDL